MLDQYKIHIIVGAICLIIAYFLRLSSQETTKEEIIQLENGKYAVVKKGSHTYFKYTGVGYRTSEKDIKGYPVKYKQVRWIKETNLNCSWMPHITCNTLKEAQELLNFKGEVNLSSSIMDNAKTVGPSTLVVPVEAPDNHVRSI